MRLHYVFENVHDLHEVGFSLPSTFKIMSTSSIPEEQYYHVVDSFILTSLSSVNISNRFSYLIKFCYVSYLEDYTIHLTLNIFIQYVFRNTESTSHFIVDCWCPTATVLFESFDIELKSCVGNWNSEYKLLLVKYKASSKTILMT